MTTIEDPAAAFLAELQDLDDTELAVWAGQLPPDLAVHAQRLIAERAGQGWRAHPAAMAAHLTGGAYQRYPYIDLLSLKMRDGVNGVDPRQVWNIPSQYGKTTLACTYGVPWILEHYPQWRIMYVSYDADKAVEEGGKARDFIEEHADRLRVRLKPDRKARGMWATPEGGGLYATGIHGGITGYPAEALIMDDLMKGWIAASSEKQREHVVNIWRTQLRFRIQGSRYPIFNIGTRWHPDDITGHLLATGRRWTHIRLPAIAEQHNPESDDPLLRVPDPLGRAPGEVLEPRRFDRAEVLERAEEAGSHLAAALEQQRPSAPEGNDLKRAWFRLSEERPAEPDDLITSWDLKLKDKEEGDYVVGQVWWRVGSAYWLIDQIRGQFNHAATMNAIALLSVRHPDVPRHVIEFAGSADTVMPQLRKADPEYTVDDETATLLSMSDEERKAVGELRRRGMTGLLPSTPKGDKRVRARAYIAPMAESGHVWILKEPDRNGYVPQLLEELANFPNAAHDDQVDAMALGLGILSGRVKVKVVVDVNPLAARIG